MSYLLSKGLINKHQHAFIKKHSTVTNLLECTHDWAVAIHGGFAVDAIYIDFSRAFDSVVHSKLLYKLSNFGITGNLLAFISSFLSNRLQCVVTEHCFSEWVPVLSGVPQGSVLGPILFILYIDDISTICFNSTVSYKLFADDFKLYSQLATDLDQASLQSALGRLQQWCIDWQMAININKSHVLHLGKNNKQTNYYLNGNLIDAQQSVADLGVEIDCTLSFDNHINRIIGKAYSRVGVIYKGFASRDARILKQAYITYVRPVLEYASSVWSPYLLKHINAIERVQKHFTKRIPSLSHLTYPERLAAIDLEPLELRRLKADLVLYYKCLNNLTALPYTDYFNLSNYTTQTRTGGSRLIVPLCSTNRFANDFFIRCINCWNSMSSDIVNSNSIKHLKKTTNKL